MKSEALYAWLLELGVIEESVTSLDVITRLDLSGKKLTQLPDDFGDLSNLVVLNLANNQITSLPESFAKLKKLSNLDLRRNRLEVLPTLLSALSLRSLNVSYNRLHDAKALKECLHVRVVDLSGNVLRSVDECFGETNEIRTLNISSNMLENVKEALKMLVNIERLNLGDNLIKEIPSSIASCENLEECDISHNHIEKIDEQFFTLGLLHVDLSGNLLRHLTLHDLEELEVLILDDNPFRKLEIGSYFAPYLKEFSCDSCALKEFLLPSSEQLTLLCYSSNQIEYLPQKIENYKLLQKLDIEANNIVDLPDSLANLFYLETLYVNGNPLSEEAKKVIQVLDPEICDLNMKTGISIEAAGEDDLPQMAQLLSVLFTIETDFTIDYKKQLAGIKRLYEHHSSDLLVAKYENKVVGMVTMQRLISSAEGDFVGQIEDLVVEEQFRKMGVASRLLNKIRSIAIEHGYKRIQLAADVDNKNALQFYNRRGFKKTNLSVYHYIIS